MIHDPGTSIVITDGYWMHIRHMRICHRRYPEVRGEGRSLADAASHLMNQLTRCLDFAHGREREAIEWALADVRARRGIVIQGGTGMSPFRDEVGPCGRNEVSPRP
jgi:hypothetical protein